MATEKRGLDDGCTIFIFSADDGCTRWWRWSHHFRRVILDTHIHTQPIPYRQKCMILVISIACRSLILIKNVYLKSFPPQLKTNLWMIWHHKFKLLLRATHSSFQGVVIGVEQCAKFETIPPIMHGTLQFEPFHLFKIAQEWLVERRKIPRLPGGRFKNGYELLNPRALKISMLYKNRIFQCMGKIFCVEFQRFPLKFHTKYLIHTLKVVHFIHRWNFKSS